MLDLLEGAGGSVGGELPEVLCVGGLDSPHCSRRVDVLLEDTERIVDVLDAIWADRPGGLVLLVAPSLRGFQRLLGRLRELGRNHFLVEATGTPEAVLSGLPLDRLVEYHAGLLVLSGGVRRGARPRRPAVTRRQLFRSMFLVSPEHVYIPRLPRSCPPEVCPYEAIRGRGGLDEARCRGCLVCLHECGLEPPAWTGVAGLAYAYRFVAEHSLDGVLFVCRERLESLEDRVAEAGGARLLPFHVPCIGWLSPRLLEALRGLDVYTHVYGGPGVCGGCRLEKGGLKAAKLLASRGLVVSGSLAEASLHAYTGYSASRPGLGEALERLRAALQEGRESRG